MRARGLPLGIKLKAGSAPKSIGPALPAEVRGVASSRGDHLEGSSMGGVPGAAPTGGCDRPDYFAALPDKLPTEMIEGSDVFLGVGPWADTALKLAQAQLAAEASMLGAVFEPSDGARSTSAAFGPLFSPETVVRGLNDRTAPLLADHKPSVQPVGMASGGRRPVERAEAAELSVPIVVPGPGPVAAPVRPLQPVPPAAPAPEDGPVPSNSWSELLEPRAPAPAAARSQDVAEAPAKSKPYVVVPVAGGFAPPSSLVQAPRDRLIVASASRDSPTTAEHSSFRDNEESQPGDSDFDGDADEPSSPDSVGFWQAMSSRRYVETMVHVLILALGFEQFESGNLGRDLCTVFAHIKPTAQARTGARTTGPFVCWPEDAPPTPELSPARQDAEPSSADAAGAIAGPPPLPSAFPAAGLPSAPMPSDSSGGSSVPTQLSSLAPPSLSGLLAPPPDAGAAAAAKTSPPGARAASATGAASESSSDRGRPVLRLRVRSASKHRVESEAAKRLRTRLMSGSVDLSDITVMTHKSGAAKRRRSALRALMASVVAAALAAKIVDASVFQIPTVRRVATRSRKRTNSGAWGDDGGDRAPASAAKRSGSGAWSDDRGDPAVSSAASRTHHSGDPGPGGDRALRARPGMRTAADSAIAAAVGSPISLYDEHLPFIARPAVAIATLSALASVPSGSHYGARTMGMPAASALATTLSGRAWRAGPETEADTVPNAPLSHQPSGLTAMPSADFACAGGEWPGDGTGGRAYDAAIGFSLPGSGASAVGALPSRSSLPGGRSLLELSHAGQQRALWHGEQAAPRGYPLAATYGHVGFGSAGPDAEGMLELLSRLPPDRRRMFAAHLTRGTGLSASSASMPPHQVRGGISVPLQPHPAAHHLATSLGFAPSDPRTAPAPYGAHYAGMPPPAGGQGRWHPDPREALMQADMRAASAQRFERLPSTAGDADSSARFAAAMTEASRQARDEWMDRQRASGQAHAFRMAQEVAAQRQYMMSQQAMQGARQHFHPGVHPGAGGYPGQPMP